MGGASDSPTNPLSVVWQISVGAATEARQYHRHRLLNPNRHHHRHFCRRGGDDSCDDVDDGGGVQMAGQGGAFLKASDGELLMRNVFWVEDDDGLEVMSSDCVGLEEGGLPSAP